MTHIHEFVIPAPTEGPPLGVCSECGEERMHANYEDNSKGFLQRGPKPKRPYNGWVTKKAKEDGDAAAD